MNMTDGVISRGSWLRKSAGVSCGKTAAALQNAELERVEQLALRLNDVESHLNLGAKTGRLQTWYPSPKHGAHHCKMASICKYLACRKHVGTFCRTIHES